MTIIPAIDIIDGKAVRLTKGDFEKKKVYDTDPVSVARKFEDAGFRRLHLVDLDGARERCITHLRVLEKIAKSTRLQIDFGGGVKTREDVKSVLDAGAFQCTIGSMAVKHPELLQEWIHEFGAAVFFIGADVSGEQIRVSGWAEKTGVSVFDFMESIQKTGLKNFFCTDISKDGMLKGTAVDLYRKIIHRFPEISLTASGGVATVNDFAELESAGCAGAIVGKAIYEKKISLIDLKKFDC